MFGNQSFFKPHHDVKYLHGCTKPVYEDKRIAILNIHLHLVGNDTAKGIEAFAHIGRIRVKIRSIRGCKTKHRLKDLRL